MAKGCAVAGCDRALHARGFCNTHYVQQLKGKPLTRLRPPMTVEDRFWSTVDRSGPMNPFLGSQCWLWMASKHPYGYGQIMIDDRPIGAHRLSCEWGMGMFWPTYRHLQVDHHYACPKNCVNPQHLRPATTKQQSENLPGAQQNNKSSGIRGVYWHAHSGKWRVLVGHDGRQFSGGYFNDQALAEQAAIRLRNELFTHNDKDRMPA